MQRLGNRPVIEYACGKVVYTTGVEAPYLECRQSDLAAVCEKIWRLDLFYEDMHPCWFVKNFLVPWKTRKTQDLSTIGIRASFSFDPKL